MLSNSPQPAHWLSATQQTAGLRCEARLQAGISKSYQPVDLPLQVRHAGRTMDRREFVASFAALGATAALPTVAAAQPNPPTSAPGTPPVALPDALRMATLHKETPRQLTTFNLARKSKTIRVPRGKRVTIGEVKGRGYIAQFWLTFPGWFWQHWNPKAPINQSILKTLILRLYRSEERRVGKESRSEW